MSQSLRGKDSATFSAKALKEGNSGNRGNVMRKKMLKKVNEMDIEIKINFIKDLRNRIIEDFEISNVYVEHKKLSDWDILYFHQYFVMRCIDIKPRKVHFSKEFEIGKKFKRTIKNIVSGFENGDDMNVYISKSVEKLNSVDPLLNDWGVYHLHLGDSIEECTAYITRTKELLFARITSEDAYFIGIYKHGDWCRQEILKILHDNWPESLERYRLYGITGDNLSDNEIKNIRNFNGNYCLGMDDGTVYTSLGGGFTSSGHNMKIVMEVDVILNMLTSYERHIKDNIQAFVHEIEMRNEYKVTYLDFQLVEFSKPFRVLEKNSGIIFNIP